MSNSTTKTQNQQVKPTKNIEIGKFYLIHDGSPSGHPDLVIWKDDPKNLYLAIKFGSSPSKDNTKFSYALSNDITNSYYYNRLFVGKRKNFGSIELTRLTILFKHLNELLKAFDFLNPTYSPNINSKDRYQYKRRIKIR